MVVFSGPVAFLIIGGFAFSLWVADDMNTTLKILVILQILKILLIDLPDKNNFFYNLKD